MISKNAVKQFFKKNLPRVVGGYLNILAFLFPAYTAKLAIKIFAKPRKGRLSEFHKNFLSTATMTDSFELEGERINYYSFGNGSKSVILAHGWESNAARWRKLIKKINDIDYKMIALDAPAHGASGGRHFSVIAYAKAINYLSKKYDVSAIVGHSIGGLGAILSTCIGDEKKQVYVISLGAPHSLASILDQYYDIINLSPSMRRRIQSDFHSNYNVLLEDIDIQYFGKNLHVDGMVVHDENDKINDVTSAKIIHQHWNKSKLIITQDGDHSLQNENIYKLIKNALNAQ